MEKMIIQSIILLLVVGINYGCIRLIRSNPDILSGFKMSDDPYQRERDKEWVKKLLSYLFRASILTFLCGLAGIIFRLPTLYLLSLILPTAIAYITADLSRSTKTDKKRKTRIVTIIKIASVLLICIPILFISRSDLKVKFNDSGLEVSGLYGVTIPYSAIKQVSLCDSLPRLKIRTNGFALGDTRLGHFRTSDGKRITLFTHSDKECIRIVKTDGSIYYLSYKENDETKVLLREILDRTELNPQKSDCSKPHTSTKPGFSKPEGQVLQTNR